MSTKCTQWQRHSLKVQRGMTLMELLLVLSVVAFIIVGALTLYESADSGARSQRAQYQLLGLTSNIRSLFAASGEYTQLDEDGEELIEGAGLVPDDMKAGAADGIIRNVWNGTVTVSSGVDGTACGGVERIPDGFATRNAFCVQFTNVESTACIKILSNAFVGFEAASAGGNNLRNVVDLVTNISLNAAQCTAAEGGRVSMNFLFQ